MVYGNVQGTVRGIIHHYAANCSGTWSTSAHSHVNHELYDVLNSQVSILTDAAQKSNVSQLPQGVRDAITKHKLRFEKEIGRAHV